MKKVYADNGATSFPKAPGTADAMKDFLDNVGCNVNRGGFESAYQTALNILNTRKMLCEVFHFDEPRNVVFTPGITWSLNIILQGFLKSGDHIITTSMEHNAVMRPLHGLSLSGVSYDLVKCSHDGSLNPKDIISLINKNTKAVIMTHASNVCGTILPLSDVAEICGKLDIKLIVDTAQTAGSVDIDMKYVDALAFTAHKGLLAAQGLGGFIVTNEMAKQIRPIITGGTGSLSHVIEQPDFMPDKFESGTVNIPAIIGLQKSLEYIRSVGIPAIYEKEMKLTEAFISEIMKVNHVKVIGKKEIGKNEIDGRTAVISLDFESRDNAEIAGILDSDYGIMTRCGLHCAPYAHKTLGTYPRGTVRFSFGHFNTIDDIEYIVESIKDILRRGA